jgi:signal transduction histidine kinase
VQITDFTFPRLVRTYLTVGVFFVVLQTYALTTFGISLKFALTDALVNNILILLAGVSTYNVLRFYKPARENLLYPRVWAVLLAISITLIFEGIMHVVFAGEAVYLEFMVKSLFIRGMYNLLNIALLSVFVFLWFYFSDEQKKQKLMTDAETLTREAELVSLRQQLQPHFLFNSLNSISALVGTRPEEARKMIHQLSDFLRGTLRKDEQKLISLKDEMRHLQLYLDIEKVRFGHRLSTIIHSPEQYLQCNLPPLVLQPLVENAIKFGLYDVTGDVTISINCECDSRYLTVTITNPFDSQTSTPKKGAGFGLSSVQRRLYLLYARNDLLQTSHENNLFTTTIKIPQTA